MAAGKVWDPGTEAFVDLTTTGASYAVTTEDENPAPYFSVNTPVHPHDTFDNTFAPGANAMVATAFIVEKRQTFNRIGTVIGSTSGNVCAAILDDDGTGGAGNTRLSTSGSLACPANGAAAIVIATVTLDPGWYWAALAFDNGSVTLPYRAGSTGSDPFRAVRCDKAAAFVIPATVGATLSATAPFFIVPGYV